MLKNFNFNKYKRQYLCLLSFLVLLTPIVYANIKANSENVAKDPAKKEDIFQLIS